MDKHIIKNITLLLFSVLFVVFLNNCKTNRVNKHGQWTGLWIMKDTSYGKPYLYRGRFKKGMEKRKWKYYWDGHLVRSEKYRGNIADTKFYHENGRIKSEGKTVIVSNNKEIHWFYNGPWKYYDSLGRLSNIKTFDKGQLIAEKNIQE